MAAPNLFEQGSCSEYRTRHEIMMPAKKLGRAVDDEVDSKTQRVLIDWGPDGVVAEGEHVVLPAQPSNMIKISQPQERVGRCFDDQESGLGRDCRLKGRGLCLIDDAR